MNIIRLGMTELKVPELGFGGIPIQRLSEFDAVSVVKKCLELGIKFLDTANGYSTSEERIGKAIAGKRHEVIIATKSGARTIPEMEQHLNLSLQRLATDYIDLYQFHGVSDFDSLENILATQGLYAFLLDAKKRGLVRHIGITSHQIDVAKKAVQSNLFETLMFPFNFITNEAAEEFIPLCQKHDVGFIAMKPLAGGMVNKAGIAFKYLRQFPGILTIPGIERIPEIEEIAQIYERPLEMTDDEKKEMQEIKESLGSRFCHRCDYCQPCTVGIPISLVMSAKSFYKRLPPERFFSNMVMPAMEKAALCEQCGVCETRCPYALPIREMIAEQLAWFRDVLNKYENELEVR